MRTQILAKLYPNEADRAKHTDDNIFMTLAFEKNAECFNPIIYSVPPTPITPPSIPVNPEGSQVTIRSNDKQRIGQSEISNGEVNAL